MNISGGNNNSDTYVGSWNNTTELQRVYTFPECDLFIQYIITMMVVCENFLHSWYDGDNQNTNIAMHVKFGTQII